MNITCFLPCRKGSQRIPNKNIRPFGNSEFGLLEIKLNQLVLVKNISNIIVSSNDESVLSYARRINDSKIRIDVRPESLGSSKTSTDSLIEYAGSLVPDGHLLWTHVTSPFIGPEDYDNILRTYIEKYSHGYDSLMTVKRIQSFLWNENGPLNYDRLIEKWPRTQTIEPIYEIDSAVFIAPLQVYRNQKDRIGKKPYLFEQDAKKSLDIDWPDDFELAEALWINQEQR